MLPPLLLSTKSKKRPITPLFPRNLDNEEAHEIRQRPVTAMRAQHVQVLDIKRAAAAREVVIDLAVIVKKKHALLGDFLAGEVVCLHFDR